MQIELLHPDHISFPATKFDWSAEAVTPIGSVVKRGSAPRPLGIIEGPRSRTLVSISDGRSDPLSVVNAGPALYAALDKTCSRLWGHTWNAALGTIFGVNRRMLQQDRVSTHLLSARLLSKVGYIASADDAEELASILTAIASYERRFSDKRAVKHYVDDAVDVFYDPGEQFGFRLK